VRGEGIDVRVAYLHELGGDRRTARTKVDTSPRVVDAAATEIGALAKRGRLKCYDATPGAHCATRDVRSVCAAAR
jgi:hypothetical protein